MPFDSISDLKNSALYNRMETLQSMSEAALRVFMRAFNSAFERVKRNNGNDDEAESTAIPIALSAARRVDKQASDRALDDESTFFVAHMPAQLGRSNEGLVEAAEYETGFVTDVPDIVSSVVAGNTFTLDHGGPDLGVVEGIRLRDDLPEDIRSHVDEDAPFVFEASYYQDVPDIVRELDGVSAEWGEIGLASGKKLLLPNTFVVTPVPLNDTYTGIGKVTTEAGIDELFSQDEFGLVKEIGVSDNELEAWTKLAGYLDTENDPGEESGGNDNERKGGISTIMSSQDGDGDVSLTDLQDKLDDKHASQLGDLLDERDDLQSRVEEMEASLEEFEELKASLSEEGDDPEEFDAQERFASLQEELSEERSEKEQIEQRLASIEDELLEERADAFCEEKLAGRVPTEAWSDWKTDFKEDPERTKRLASSLPEKAELLGNEEKEASSLQEDEQSEVDKVINKVAGVQTEGDE